MIKLFEQFNNEQEIHDICKKYRIENYTINDDGSIDVNGSVDFFNSNLDKLPLKFNIVSGYFNCSNNNLTSLDGCPKEVDNFYCSRNYLTSLKGCPNKIFNVFQCRNNRLTSLYGLPYYIGDNFDCSYNPINKIDRECEINGNIFLDNTNLDSKIIYLDQHYLNNIFKHGLDYKIFNNDGSINDSRLNHFLNDFKE